MVSKMTETKTEAFMVSPPFTPQKKTSAKPTPLPSDYTPSATTVIVGRGKKFKRHPGNQNLTAIVQSKLMEYSQAEKTAKSFILARVMKMIRDNNPDQICFVKRDPKTAAWMSLPVGHARACVAQEFRDALHHNYRSSKHSKQRRRMKEKGHEFKPAPIDPICPQLDACNEAIPTENVSLLTGFAEEFQQARNTKIICEHQSLDQIRSLIHVPPRRSGFANEMVPSMRTMNMAAPCNYRSQAAHVASEYTASQLMGSMRRAQEIRHFQPSMEAQNTRFYGNGFSEPMARPEVSVSVRGNGAAMNHDSSFDLACGDEGEIDLYQPYDFRDSMGDLPMLNY